MIYLYSLELASVSFATALWAWRFENHTYHKVTNKCWQNAQGYETIFWIWANHIAVRRRSWSQAIHYCIHDLTDIRNTRQITHNVYCCEKWQNKNVNNWTRFRIKCNLQVVVKLSMMKGYKVGSIAQKINQIINERVTCGAIHPKTSLRVNPS